MFKTEKKYSANGRYVEIARESFIVSSEAEYGWEADRYRDDRKIVDLSSNKVIASYDDWYNSDEDFDRYYEILELCGIIDPAPVKSVGEVTNAFRDLLMADEEIPF